ncbi:MAG: GAF domain-containing protein [Anaerolineae bacterium]|nr:GAF domain-containing protein [Anaerolineae bacterium]
MTEWESLAGWTDQLIQFAHRGQALAIGIFDAAGKPHYLNEGMQRVLGHVGDAGITLFDYLTVPPTASPDQPVYAGWLTFERPALPPISLRGEIWRRAGQIVIIAERGGDELQTLNDQMLAETAKRKQIEQTVQASEEHLRQIIMNNVDGIIIVDQAGVLQFVNPAAETLFKRKAADLVGTLFDFPLTSDIVELKIERGPDDMVWAEMRVVELVWQQQNVSLASLRDITARKSTEEKLVNITYDLGERVKELNCLYGISHLVETPGISLHDMLQSTVNLIPPSWQQPPLTCARITLDDQVFQTDNFSETAWRQTRPIEVHGQPAGRIDVYHLTDPSKGAETPFLPEEDGLLHAIAIQLGNIIEHKRNQAALAYESTINATVANLSETLLQAHSFSDISNLVLDTARDLTQSQFGYVGYIEPQTHYLISPTLTHDIWDQCQVDDKNFVFKEWGGLWGWVLENKQSMLTNTPAADPRSSGTPKGHLPIKRFLSVPALIGETLVGQIALANAKADYTRQDLLLVERLAVLFAIAIQRKTSEEALRQHAAEQAALYGIAAAVTTSLNPDELGAIALDVALTVLDADAGWITYFSSSNWEQTGRVVARRSLLDHVEIHSLPQCQTCEPLQQPNTMTMMPIPMCPLAKSFGMTELPGNYICTPLIASGETLGMLTLIWQRSERDFATNQLILQTIGHQIGMALHNAQLYHAARQVDRLRILNELDDALIDAALEPETLMRATLQHLVNAVNASMGALIMPENELMTLNIIMPGEHWIEAEVSETFMARWQPLWAQMYQQKQVIGFDDPGVTAIPALQQDLTEFWGKHGLIVPIADGRELRALLVLGGRPSKQPFGDEDRALVLTAASRSSQAIRNAQLYKSEQHQRRLAEALRDTAAVINSTLNFDDVLDRILRLVGQVVPHDAATILLVEGSFARVVRCTGFAERGMEETIMAQQFSVTDYPGFSYMYQSGNPILRPDVLEAHDWVEVPGVEWVRSFVTSPIKIEGKVIGFLSVDSATPGAFTVKDVDQLQAFAHQAAVAIQNARLYDQLKSSLAARERTQAQLVHSEKTAALGRLTASIAHEINNPIQAVQGCVTLAQTEWANVAPQIANDKHRHKLNRYLGVVEEEIDRIAAIVKRMRDFYRPARDTFQQTDVHRVLDSVIALVDAQLRHSAITLEKTLHNQLPLIEANPDHLKQVFLNLILNAADAMPQGGTLYIQTGRTHIQYQSLYTLAMEVKQPAVQITFRDTGEGIAPAIFEHLFEPFFTTKSQGSGLGLSVSYSIIEAHHGQISVTSPPNTGASFTVLLPVKQPHDDAHNSFQAEVPKIT